MTEVRSARIAFLWVGMIVPLALLAFATALIWAWLPELPEMVAIHWGANGVDGYGPSWTYPALTMGLGGGMVVLLAIFALFAHRMPQSAHTSHSTPARASKWSPTARFLGAINLGTSSMIALLMITSVNAQRGLENAAQAPGVMLWVVVGLGLLVGMTILGWFLQPRVSVSADAGQQNASGILLAPGEKAAWFGRVAMGRVGMIILVLSVLLLIGATVLAFVTDEGGAASWIMAITTVLVIVLIAATLVFRVRVSSAGLLVRSAVGLPRWSIGASKIASVSVVQVNPVAEFGGWGLRISVDGRMGVVLRTGEALQINRKQGRTFVVTVDDARTAAAVLTSAMNQTDMSESGGLS